ncbi:MAG: DUF3106 domain-containing protein [Acidobacteriota bacterium]|nr:DUF3106 domain-containing protein [Acidobacteriota bacterium]
MKGAARARVACTAALAAAMVWLCAFSPLLQAQRRGQSQQSERQRPERPRNVQPRNENSGSNREIPPRQQRQFGNERRSFQPNPEAGSQNRNGFRPNRNSIPQYRGPEGRGQQRGSQFDQPRFEQPGYSRGEQGTRPGYERPGYSNYPAPVYAPPGHLGAWLNDHRGVPIQQQEQMLRRDPSFSRLPKSDQQRLIQQLHQVDQMPEAQRERRLARAEALERLSPQQRAQVNLAARRWATMPPGRQERMREAFRDLRGVPPNQRDTMLNSERYKDNFSPEERGILSDMLRVEPYAPPK